MRRTQGITRNRMLTFTQIKQAKRITPQRSSLDGLSRFSSRRLKGEIEMVDAQTLKRPFMQEISTDGTIQGARPPWINLYEECQSLLMDVEEKRKEMMLNQNKRLSCVRVTEQKECEVRIYECAKEATRGIRKCEKIVQHIQQHGKDQTAANARICQSLSFKLAAEIQQATRTLRAQEKSFVQQRKQFQETEKVSFLDVAMQSALGNGVFMDEQLIEDEQMKDLEERNQEIKNIVESIYELNTIYKELNQLVILQGSLLDRIDQNVQSSRVAVESGHKHLQSAQKYQKKTSRCACKVMIVMMVCIGILLIVLMAKWFS